MVDTSAIESSDLYDKLRDPAVDLGWYVFLCVAVTYRISLPARVQMNLAASQGCGPPSGAGRLPPPRDTSNGVTPSPAPRNTQPAL